MACCPRSGIPPSPQLNSQLVFGNTGIWYSRDPEAIFRRRRHKTGRKRCHFYGCSLAQWCGRRTERRFLRGEKKISPLSGGGEWPRMTELIHSHFPKGPQARSGVTHLSSRSLDSVPYRRVGYIRLAICSRCAQFGLGGGSLLVC